MEGSTPCPDGHLLQSFLLATLPQAEAASLEDHVQGCAACCAAAQKLQATDTLVDAMRGRATLVEEQDGELIANLLSKLGSGQDEEPLKSASEWLAPAQGPDEMGRLGSYRILQELGRGGMGIVFQAEDIGLKRRVALKLMKTTLAESAECRQRFLREAQTAATLDHEHIVTIYQVGEECGIPFLAMQYLQGESLETRLQRTGPLPVSECLRIGKQIAHGLKAAHERGIIHRDIKPSNIWIEPSGRVKILDFGLALMVGNDPRLTATGTLIGTPAYMAPELARGGDFDARCDLFSLGGVLYQMGTGTLPFSGSHTVAQLMSLALDDPLPPQTRNPGLPGAFADVVLKLLSKNPAERPATADAVVDLLSAVEREPWQATGQQPVPPGRGALFCSWRRRAALAAALLLGASLTLFAYQFLQQRGDRPKAEAIPAPADAEPARQESRIYPLAILPFEERGTGARDRGVSVSDILFSRLAANPALYLVDRQDLKKTLQEQELSVSGMVKDAEAARVGQLTGAKLLVTGSVAQVDKKIYLVAKVISTETGRLVGASVDGKASDELGPLVEQLADKLVGTIVKEADKLVPPPASKRDRVAALNRQLGKSRRPTLWVKIGERHIGQSTSDPAAQTEMILFSRGVGFDVIDDEAGSRGQAELSISGEGISELAGRHGGLVSVKARVEVKVVDRKTDKVIAVDRQTSVAADLSEQIAGKSALQKSAAAIAERLLPKLVKE